MASASEVQKDGGTAQRIHNREERGEYQDGGFDFGEQSGSEIQQEVRSSRKLECPIIPEDGLRSRQ
jgi:hypothetical protein